MEFTIMGYTGFRVYVRVDGVFYGSLGLEFAVLTPNPKPHKPFTVN